MNDLQMFSVLTTNKDVGMNRYALVIGFWVLCAATLPVRADVATWIPPSDDLVGTGMTPHASGINDWHIRINSARLAGQSAIGWRIVGGLWYSFSDSGRWWAPGDASLPSSLIKVDQAGGQVDLHFEPVLAWPGDIFTVTAIFGPQKSLEWRVISNGEGWLPGALWLGQGSRDRVGCRANEPDGIRDWEIAIDDPFIQGEPAKVDVFLPFPAMGNRLARTQVYEQWSSYAERAMPLVVDTRSGGATISINPVLAGGGDQLVVRVVRGDKTWALWKVIGMGSEWKSGGEWYGQDQFDFVGTYAVEPNKVQDWHLRVASPDLVAPVRWMVKGAQVVWEAVEQGRKRIDVSSHALLADVKGHSADLFLDPAMERAGDTFYVSAILPDGRMISWGVISTRQVRSERVKWLGQAPEMQTLTAQAGRTNAVSQWCIAVEHEKLLTQQPYQWNIACNGKKWQEPRETSKDLADTQPLRVTTAPQGARLYLDPEWTRPGDEYDIQAAFPDGTIVQWTALASGSEWARAGMWLDADGSDVVGLDPGQGPDQRVDWLINIRDEALREPLAALDVIGCGWRWHWPDTPGMSPIVVTPEGDAATLHLTPGPSGDAGVLTIKALFSSGTVRFWQAVKALPK